MSTTFHSPILVGVPKLWNDTIDAHRRAVHDSIVNATAALVAKRGLSGVTMSEVAERAGIGRATLYKYFSDIQSILIAWHERQVGEHLATLGKIRDRPGHPRARLQAVLEAYALVSHERHEAELVTLLHRGAHMAHAHDQLHSLVRDLIAEGAADGDFRKDVSPDELASFCLHALTAASALRTKPAVRRLVDVTLAGLAAQI